MYTKKMFTLLSLGIALAFNSYAQTSKLVLAKGEKYEQTTITSVTSVASIMGQDMESTANTNTVEKIEVKNVSGKEIELTTVITRMVVNGNAMGQEMNFDSDKKDNSGPGAEELSASVGKVKNVTIDASGKVIREDDNINALPMDVGVKTSGLGLVKDQFIGKQIKPGMSWPDSVVTVEEKLKTTTVGIYTVSTVNDQTHIAVVDFTGNTTLTGTMEQMGQEMEMKSTNKVTGQTQLDMNTGLIIETKTTTTGTMTIEAGGMSIPVTVNSTATTSIKKI
jgi:hypothetical protein